MNGRDHELRRLLHRAFDGEQPRPGVVDDIVQKARTSALPRPTSRRLRAAPLAGALVIPLAAAGVAVAIGLTHHRGTGGNVANPPHVSPTPSLVNPSPLPAPAHYIPWNPLPPGSDAGATPTPLPVPPGTPPCRANQLEGAQVGFFGATGNDDLPIVLRNRSASACMLMGYADLRIYDASGRLLAQAVGTTHRGTFFDSSSTGAPVLLQPGTPALQSSDGTHGLGFPGQATLNVQWVDCSQPQAHSAALDLPSAGGRLVVPFDRAATGGGACGPTPEPAPTLGRGPFNPIAPPEVVYSLVAEIAAPGQVRAGTAVTYYVTLVNNGPNAYGFDPCPAFDEGLAGVKPVKPGPTLLELNCAPARAALTGGVLAAGASLTFEMRIDIPRTLHGPQRLSWNLLGTADLPTADASIKVLPAA